MSMNMSLRGCDINYDRICIFVTSNFLNLYFPEFSVCWSFNIINVNIAPYSFDK